MVSDDMRPYVLEDGTLAAFTSLGCYPLFYVTESGDCLCHKCAQEALECDDDEEPEDPPVDAGCNWEDPSLYCDDCGERIESAYAEDEVMGEGEDHAD